MIGILGIDRSFEGVTKSQCFHQDRAWNRTLIWDRAIQMKSAAGVIQGRVRDFNASAPCRTCASWGKPLRTKMPVTRSVGGARQTGPFRGRGWVEASSARTTRTTASPANNAGVSMVIIYGEGPVMTRCWPPERPPRPHFSCRAGKSRAMLQKFYPSSGEMLKNSIPAPQTRRRCGLAVKWPEDSGRDRTGLRFRPQSRLRRPAPVSTRMGVPMPPSTTHSVWPNRSESLTTKNSPDNKSAWPEGKIAHERGNDLQNRQ